MAGRFDDNNKRIHAQRKFAQGAAVLPSRESLREQPLQNPVQREADPVQPVICNDRAEDFLTKVCFDGWDSEPETMPEMALKIPVVLLSDVLKNPPDAQQPKASTLPDSKQLKLSNQPDTKQPKAPDQPDVNSDANKNMVPFAVRKSASKVPLSRLDLKRKMSSQNTKENIAAEKDSKISFSPKRKSLRSALKNLSSKLAPSSKDNNFGLLSLRNRNINKKTPVSKVKKDKVTHVASTSTTNGTKRSSLPRNSQASKFVSIVAQASNTEILNKSFEKSFTDSDEEPLAKQVKKKKRVRFHIAQPMLKKVQFMSQKVKNTRNFSRNKKKTYIHNKTKKNRHVPTKITKDDIYEFCEEAEATEQPSKRQTSVYIERPDNLPTLNKSLLQSRNASVCRPSTSCSDHKNLGEASHYIDNNEHVEALSVTDHRDPASNETNKPSNSKEYIDINEYFGECIQPESNGKNYSESITVNEDQPQPIVDSNQYQQTHKTNIHEVRLACLLAEDPSDIEENHQSISIFEEKEDTNKALEVVNVIDSQEMSEVLSSSSQDILLSSQESIISDIKSEDKDVIFVKNVQIPNIPLQKQIDSIIKQVADLKNTVKLTSNPKAFSQPTKNTQRTSIRPRQGRGKSSLPIETIPKIMPVNNTAFPKAKDSANIVDAPVFMPTEEEFQDPFDYIEKITPYASLFGIARIVPPPNFKPECKLDNDVRFTSNKQFIHRMRSRWGTSTRDMVAITSYLKTQQISLDSLPIIGGLEADLPRLYQVVEEMGGVKEVMDNWAQVATAMNIPKSVPNPKLQEIYFKYILPFVTLSVEERESYFRKANLMWAAAKAKKKSRRKTSYSPAMVDIVLQDDSSYTDIVLEEMDCVTKGKMMTYTSFTKMCKNAMNMWFGSSQYSGNLTPDPAPEVVEKEFWKIVEKVDKHVVVHSASINTGDSGIGFPEATKEDDPSTNHPWNLKVMCSNPRSVLRSMGTLMGVSIPTLHLGMVFSTSCWYRDPHGLPWMEYLHTGSPKIWYGLPESEGERFKAGFKNLAPFVCKNKKIWLPSDTTMIPPEMLRDTGVSLCRTVQNSGEYILVFSKAYSSSISTGACVSESVYLSPFSWLTTAYNDFEDLHGSCEPSLFSLEHLLISIAEDPTSNNRLLMHSHSLLTKIFESEKENRGSLRSLNIPLDERPARCEEGAMFPALVQARNGDDTEECDVCKQRLHLSFVYDLNDDDQIYCLPHAIENITNETVDNYSNAVVHCKYSSAQLNTIMKRLIDRLTIDIREKPQSTQQNV